MSRKRHRPTGEEALATAFAAVDHTPLLDALGVVLPDELLRHALTHRSFEIGRASCRERV